MREDWIDPAKVERARIASEIRFERLAAGSYAAVLRATGERVGEIDKTGTHLDFYPWGWLITGFDVPRQSNGLRRTTGQTDTLRAAKDAITSAYVRHREATEAR